MTTQINETTPAAGTLEHIDPNVLLVETNVRTEASLTKQFIASLKELGVRTPVTAVRGTDGVVRVRTGQRRTLGAREAGLRSIPVYITDEVPGHAADNVDRLVEQITENDQRSALTQADRVNGIQQLLDTGLSITKVAKKLAVSGERVRNSKAVAGSQTALDALSDPARPVTLAEAAAIAEFDGDDDAVERLRRCAGGQYFEHQLSQLRRAREDAALQEAAAKEWRDKGYAVLSEQPASFDPDPQCVPLDSLLRPDGQPATDADVTDPAQWAVLMTEDTVFTDKETGELVNEFDVDWDTEDNPDSEPEEGQRHFNSVTETTGWAPEYFCLDYTAAGLTPTERFLGGRNNFPGVEADEAADNDGAPTVDELVERRAKAAAAQEEADKRDRRKVVALNRLGDAAQEVRREFVKTLLARKTAPKGAATFIATILADDPFLLTTNGGGQTAAELLGAPARAFNSGNLADSETRTGGVRELVAKAGGDARATVITLGLVLGALEARCPKDAWRGVNGYTWRGAGSKAYLGFLADNGYTLAPVEEVITGKKKADKVYDAWLAQK
jgi:ParB family chromosome partitioning protein